MNSADWKVLKTTDIISDLLNIAVDGKKLEAIPGCSDIKFAIKEYTNSRFYYNINKLLSREEFHKIPNYLCSILRYLPDH
jgi:hypothetical protein